MASETPPDPPSSADRDDLPRDDDAAERSDPPTSLTHRWWWQGAVLVVAGIAVVAFQWEVIPSGEANLANWLVGLLGAAAIGYGLLELVATHRRRKSADAPPQDSVP